MPEDEGQWVAVSANMILDGHNCAWLTQYPRQALAGGSMYTLLLPAHIPAAGSAGGPPLPSAFHEFGGGPFDLRALFTYVDEHPDDLPRAMEWIQAAFSSYNKSQASPPKPPWER